MSHPFQRSTVNCAMAMELVTDDGGVLKQVIKEGTGPCVQESSFVIFHYNAYLGEDSPEPFDSTWLRNQPHRASMDTVLVRGLALALMGMRKDEQCRVLVSPEYAFGALGCPPRIPPAATLLYEVTLLNFVQLEGDTNELQGYRRRDFKRLDFETLVEMCGRAHRNGNRLFDVGDHHAASSCYNAAIRALTSALSPRQCRDDHPLSTQLLVKLYANMALCALRSQNWEQAVRCGRSALEVDGACAKALYLCGVGLRKLGRLEEAADMMRRAARIEPNSADLAREMVALNKELARERADEAALCRRMIRGLGMSQVLPVEARRDAILEAVEPIQRRRIERALGELKSRPKGSSRAFTDGFSKSEVDYVRLTCRDMGLACEDFEEGVMATVIGAPDPGDSVDPGTRRVIARAIEALAEAPENTSLPFVDGFTEAELDYVRALCREKGLACVDFEDGVKATAMTAA